MLNREGGTSSFFIGLPELKLSIFSLFIVLLVEMSPIYAREYPQFLCPCFDKMLKKEFLTKRNLKSQSSPYCQNTIILRIYLK